MPIIKPITDAGKRETKSVRNQIFIKGKKLISYLKKRRTI